MNQKVSGSFRSAGNVKTVLDITLYLTSVYKTLDNFTSLKLASLNLTFCFSSDEILEVFSSIRTKTIGRESKSCLGRVLNFKLSFFVMSAIACHTRIRLHLELKTRPRFCPIWLKFVHGYGNVFRAKYYKNILVISRVVLN
jgi:hypothetical protein